MDLIIAYTNWKYIEIETHFNLVFNNLYQSTLNPIFKCFRQIKAQVIDTKL